MNLNIVDKFNITGRGICLVSDTLYDDHVEYTAGWDISFKGITYIVKSVEAILKIEDNKNVDYVALIVSPK
jgi:hypothetical protein